jgi:hypothetical protein
VSWGVVDGGHGNTIDSESSYSSIGGGYLNSISFNAWGSTIGGGRANKIGADSDSSTVAGGALNEIGDTAIRSTIGGGWENTIRSGAPSSTIAGGMFNDVASNSSATTISGGVNNKVDIDSPGNTISGGNGHQVGSNSRFNNISGGFTHVIADHAEFATVAGGFRNFATNRAFAAGTWAIAQHNGAFVWGDSTDEGFYSPQAAVSSTNANSVTMRAAGGYRLFSNTNMSSGVFLAPGAGSWTSLSDRNTKENFRPVNPRAVLDKLVALPVSTWNYKSQPDVVRHIGPTAQDFKGAFDVGESETGITGIDADGVALAAIQGLNQKLEDQAVELEARERELNSLKARLSALEEIVTKLRTQ